MGKYKELRERLKKAVIRLAVEKHQKTVPAGPQTQQQRDKFKADLYCFLTEQMKATLDMVFTNHYAHLHPDLVE